MALSLGCTVWHFGLLAMQAAEGSRGWSPGLPAGWMTSSAPSIDPSGAWPGSSCRACCCSPYAAAAGTLLHQSCCCHPAASGAASCATFPRSAPPSAACFSCTWTRPNSPFLKLHRPRSQFLHFGINGILRLVFQNLQGRISPFLKLHVYWTLSISAYQIYVYENIKFISMKI